jgi:AraC-like DNA-binding protein
MVFRSRAPKPPLDTFVELIWLYYHPEPRPMALERVLPTGASQLIINLNEDQIRLYDPEGDYRCLTTVGTVLSGVQTRYQVIDTKEQEYVAGVVFRPGGTVRFMRVPADETSDGDIPLEFLWGRSRSAALRERLLEAAGPVDKLDAIERALGEMATNRYVHPAVAFALSKFDRAPIETSIAAVTQRIGLSPKRFIERFKAEVGMTPKRYCRIRRFQRAVSSAHRGRHIDWARLALDCGYFDQAHFIHDFRSFAGLTPTEYQAARTGFQNHVKFLQSDIAGI